MIGVMNDLWPRALLEPIHAEIETDLLDLPETESDKTVPVAKQGPPCPNPCHKTTPRQVHDNRSPERVSFFDCRLALRTEGEAE
jgi:hypothetical protein